MKKIKVIELFAGVGGFRLGLDAASNKKVTYDVVWSSQWEPGAKKQYASEIYTAHFGTSNHSCEDIAEVVRDSFHKIPDHDLLVGGFPCQDYSVARTLSQAAGLKGKKGVLWWSIHDILKKKGKDAPNFLMLENVDRLLKSPSKQRGRDFAIMLASLSDLGYAVEWRVINAADYGFPQRRRRVYILGYRRGTALYRSLNEFTDAQSWLLRDGVIASIFPVESCSNVSTFAIEGSLDSISRSFSRKSPKVSPFDIAGYMIGRKVYTMKTRAVYNGPRTFLGDIILPENEISEEFFIDQKDLDKWKYLKGGKKEKRKTKDGFEYDYSEGPVAFPDSLDKPSRTIVTGEGGTAPSRFKHVIKTKSGRYRRLTPVELELLDMFPAGHTKGAPDVKRAFIAGNALVVGVIEGLGKALAKFI